MIKTYLLPCLEHYPVFWVDLYVPKGQHIMRRGSQFNNLYPLVPERVYDGLECAAV